MRLVDKDEEFLNAFYQYYSNLRIFTVAAITAAENTGFRAQEAQDRINVARRREELAEARHAAAAATIPEHIPPAGMGGAAAAAASENPLPPPRRRLQEVLREALQRRPLPRLLVLAVLQQLIPPRRLLE